ncbi:MAG: cyclase family protein [Flavobacteriales bacterium]|nr:cyclase family protein [Flavobacteriales bacterium]
MTSTIQINNQQIEADLSKPIDLSITMRPAEDCVRAWYVEPIKIEPVVGDGFIGDVNQGGAVNFRNIFFNPHGNGTHTECVGHISKETYNILDCLQENFMLAQVISISPEETNGDLVMYKEQFEGKLKNGVTAIVIRTLPNPQSKKSTNYSATNPSYLDVEATKYLRDNGINHLLIDLPSVDREEDEGALLSHHAFWEYPENTQKHRTITELIYVPDEVVDGVYLLNLQTAAFENDATPSRPVLFSIVI